MDNVVADTLSQPAWTTTSTEGDTQQPQAASLCAKPPVAIIVLQQVLYSSHRWLACVLGHLRLSSLQQVPPSNHRWLVYVCQATCCHHHFSSGIFTAATGGQQVYSAVHYPRSLHTSPADSSSLQPALVTLWLDMAAVVARQNSCPKVEVLKSGLHSESSGPPLQSASFHVTSPLATPGR